MNRLPAALVALLFSLAASAAPLRWHWSNPSPHGNNIAGIAFHADRGYVQVTDHGQCYTSPDLATWTPNDSPTTTVGPTPDARHTASASSANCATVTAGSRGAG